MDLCCSHHYHHAADTVLGLCSTALFLDYDAIGNYYDDIEYGYANGGFYTSSGCGGKLGDDVMILVFATTSGLHYYWSLSSYYLYIIIF
jgi:hypothetical protein